ncbi:kinase-like protein [Aspergillus niger]|nr:kinase-like protein [Aspergillus niger]
MARDRVEYNWIKGVETLEEYVPGGYHPIMVGDMLHNRYYIVDKIGSGGYSTVWLAHDTVFKRYVALKVNTADALPREATVLRSLSTPRSSTSLPHQGPDLLLHSAILGRSPSAAFSHLTWLERYAMDSHKQWYTHIHKDTYMELPSNFHTLSVKELYEKYGEPETVLITRCDGKPLPPNVPAKAVKPLFLGKYAETLTLADVRPLLSDFGEAFPPASEIRLGKDCHTPPAFRAPEARFDPQGPLTYSSDVWSLATAIWEIVGMKPIFSTDIMPEDETVAQHMDVLGPMPQEWWQRWEGRSKFFTEDGRPTEAYLENRWPPFEESFEIDIQKWRRSGGA